MQYYLSKMWIKCQISTLNLNIPKFKWVGAEEPTIYIPVYFIFHTDGYILKHVPFTSVILTFTWKHTYTLCTNVPIIYFQNILTISLILLLTLLIYKNIKYGVNFYVKCKTLTYIKTIFHNPNKADQILQ